LCLGKNKLSESNIKDAIRQVRRALLEADVALEVIKVFLDKVAKLIMLLSYFAIIAYLLAALLLMRFFTQDNAQHKHQKTVLKLYKAKINSPNPILKTLFVRCAVLC
jgi:hypothetical protein